MEHRAGRLTKVLGARWPKGQREEIGGWGNQRGDSPLPYQGSGLERTKSTMAWIGVSPHLMIDGILLTTTMRSAGIVVAK